MIANDENVQEMTAFKLPNPELLTIGLFELNFFSGEKAGEKNDAEKATLLPAGQSIQIGPSILVERYRNKKKGNKLISSH